MSPAPWCLSSTPTLDGASCLPAPHLCYRRPSYHSQQASSWWLSPFADLTTSLPPFSSHQLHPKANLVQTVTRWGPPPPPPELSSPSIRGLAPDSSASLPKLNHVEHQRDDHTVWHRVWSVSFISLRGHQYVFFLPSVKALLKALRGDK